MRELLAKPFYRLSHRLNRIGWWVAEHPCDRRLRKQAKAAALAEQTAHSE